jgi:hypothetical protein
MTMSVASATEDLIHLSAARLYDAECALHSAHHSGVEAWISAANRKLHEAVADYLTAINIDPAHAKARRADERLAVEI